MGETVGWISIVVIALCFLSYVGRALSGEGRWSCSAVVWLAILILFGIAIIAGLVGIMVGG